MFRREGIGGNIRLRAEFQKVDVADVDLDIVALPRAQTGVHFRGHPVPAPPTGTFQDGQP